MKILAVMNAWQPEQDTAVRWGTDVVQALAARGHAVRVLAGLAPWNLPQAPLIADMEAPVHLRVEPYPGRHWEGDVDWPGFYQQARAVVREEKEAVTLSLSPLLPAQVVDPWWLVGGGEEAAHESEGEGHHWPWPVQVALRLKKRWRKLAGGRDADPLRFQRAALHDPLVRKVGSVSQVMTAALTRDPDGPQLAADKVAPLSAGVALPGEWLAPTDSGGVAGVREMVRRALGVEWSARVLVVATVEAQERVLAAVLQALVPVLAQYPDWRVIWAGQLTYAQHALAVELGVRERLVMWPTAGNLATLLAAADVAVSLSPGDCGRAVMESLALGVPVVAARDDGASEYMREAQGRLAGAVIEDVTDTHEIASALVGLMEPSDWLVAREAAQYLAPRLTMEEHIEALEALLADVASGL